MRTTIELPDDLRIRLIEESARIGARGYSVVVERALREYFIHSADGSERGDRVDELFGAESEAPDSPVRAAWRTGRQ